MKWSWKIAEVAGIGIFVHWTFLLLLVWIVAMHVIHGSTLAAALHGIGLILAVFACVVFHELGHALAARRFDIPTRDITLLPIGGVARLERIPEKPEQELWVALAGPVVNVAIAACLFAALTTLSQLSAIVTALWPERVMSVGGDFFGQLLFINIALALFNLLPAFPMDGGRVLRALLALRFDYVRATDIAASLGQIMAILFGLLGILSSNFILLFIALFVYVGAQQEAYAAHVQSLFKSVPVREAMIRQFRALGEHDPLAIAIDALLAGEQQDFPVVDDARIVGLLTRNDLVKALSEGQRDALVGDIMRRDCQAVQDTEMLDETFRLMHRSGLRTLPVVHGDQLVGMLTLENIGEWVMVQAALQKAGPVEHLRQVIEMEM